MHIYIYIYHLFPNKRSFRGRSGVAGGIDSVNPAKLCAGTGLYGFTWSPVSAVVCLLSDTKTQASKFGRGSSQILNVASCHYLYDLPELKNGRGRKQI